MTPPNTIDADECDRLRALVAETRSFAAAAYRASRSPSAVRRHATGACGHGEPERPTGWDLACPVCNAPIGLGATESDASEIAADLPPMACASCGSAGVALVPRRAVETRGPLAPVAADPDDEQPNE